MYPQRKVPDIIERDCNAKCAQNKDYSECCFNKCVYRDTGIWLNGEVESHAILKLYENFLEDNGAGKYDQWMVTVQKSIYKCFSIRKIFGNFEWKVL